MTPHQLSPQQARRIAVRAQLLDAHRPASLLALVRHLTLVQHDLTAAVAPNADLVGWSRLGPAYDPGELAAALADRRLIELFGMIRPAADIALYTADMADWPGRGPLKDWEREVAGWVEANAGCRRDILIRLAGDGPLAAREFPDTCVVPWRSSGWTNHKNVMRMLEFMAARGEVATAGREGRERLWDLAERVYPDVPPVPAEEARRIRNERRLHALGVARARTTRMLGEPNDVGEVGEPAVIDGVRGTWRVDPSYLDDRPFAGRAALLSPLDRLVFDRKRMTEIFDFDYQLEMYKPAGQRRWGFFALPILFQDHLVGKVDCTADHAAGVLRVDAVHEDAPFDGELVEAVNAEINALAAALKLEPDYRT